MKKFKLLFIEDEKIQGDMLSDAIEDEEFTNDDGEKIDIKHVMVTTPEEAAYKLYSESFDGLIVDLKLKQGEEIESTDKVLSGNKLVIDILKKEFIPIIVRTGTPRNFSFPSEKEKEGLVKVYAKDAKTFSELINELIRMRSSILLNVFGTNGKITNTINDLFWKIIPEVRDIVQDEDALLRYVSNYISREYSYSVDNSNYLQQDPIEMYISIGSGSRICTGDILFKKDTNNYFVVLTPACDLANKKTDALLVAEVFPHEINDDFSQALKNYQENQSKKQRRRLEKFFRNANESYWYFLPSIERFNGGFVDFRKLATVPYEAECCSIDNGVYERKIGMTDPFVKELIAKFSAYYQRQGQPEFNSERVIKLLPELSN